MLRRAFSLSLAVLPALGHLESAQAAHDYPQGPITLVMPFTAGGPSDTLARIVMDRVAKALGQPVVMDYRPGANAMVALSYLSHAKPDGLTIGMTLPAMILNPLLQKKVPYQVGDFTGVARLATIPSTIAVSATAPYSTIAEMVAYSKSQPNGLTFGTAGTGGAGHLCGELLKKVSGARMLQIPYKGFAAESADLLGGQVDMIIDGIASIAPFVRGGKMKALAVSAGRRITQFPEIPTIAETYPGFEVEAFFGIVAPAATPAARVQRLSVEILRALQAERGRIEELGLVVAGQGPAEFNTTLGSETTRWRAVIKDANIRIEE